MSGYFAALPMYDWPEARAETDAFWAGLRDRLRSAGIDAPDALTRRNADLPAVPGGIRDRTGGRTGGLIAPDPASLPPDELDLATLWRHPGLLVGQTCWGPMEATGLEAHVAVLAQPDYSAFAGGQGPLYSSAIVMRKGTPGERSADGLPLGRLRGVRFAFNDRASMSGYLGISRDLEAAGMNLSVFEEHVETGAHRASILAVAGGTADICAIDCRSWSLAKRFMPECEGLEVVGWTSRHKGLPFIASRHLAPETLRKVAAAI
jgi:ABC-type phosphate/phosphonate transport system substrate-binding protein